MSGATLRRMAVAAAFAVGIWAPSPNAPTEAANAAAWQARVRGPAPAARRAPRRTVRRHHRYEHRDDIRRTRRARTATRAVVGTTVRTLPAGCRTVVRRNVRYRECGASWYRPYYRGTEVVYVVVEAP